MQPKYISKEELNMIIEGLPCEEIVILTTRKNSGISGRGKKIKKNKTKGLINKADIIIFMDEKPIRRADLRGKFSTFFKESRENIVKTLLLP